MKLSISARAFVTLVIVLGLCVLASAAVSASAIQFGRVAVFLAIACVAARLKVKLPGLTGSMSVNLPFILIAIAQMGLLEALMIGCLSSLTQCLPAAKKKFNFVQAAFNLATMAMAIWTTHLIYNSHQVTARVTSHPLQLAIAAAAFFVVNATPVAIVIAITESRKLFRTWLELCQLSFPYFLAGAGVAGLALTVPGRFDWQIATAILPLMAGVFYSYRRYFTALPQAFSDALRRPPQSQAAMAEGAKAGA